MRMIVLLQNTVHKSYQESSLHITGVAMQTGLNQMRLACQELIRANGTHVA